MLNLFYHELMEKIKEQERKTYFIVDDYMLDSIIQN